MEKAMIGTKDTMPEEQVVEYARIMQGPDPKKSTKCYHSIEAHNFHIKRYGHCVYCDLGYGEPVPKKLIEELMK
jgi:hypothetical protein